MAELSTEELGVLTTDAATRRISRNEPRLDRRRLETLLGSDAMEVITNFPGHEERNVLRIPIMVLRDIAGTIDESTALGNLLLASDHTSGDGYRYYVSEEQLIERISTFTPNSGEIGQMERHRDRDLKSGAAHTPGWKEFKASTLETILGKYWDLRLGDHWQESTGLPDGQVVISVDMHYLKGVKAEKDQRRDQRVGADDSEGHRGDNHKRGRYNRGYRDGNNGGQRY